MQHEYATLQSGKLPAEENKQGGAFHLWRLPRLAGTKASVWHEKPENEALPQIPRKWSAPPCRASSTDATQICNVAFSTRHKNKNKNESHDCINEWQEPCENVRLFLLCPVAFRVPLICHETHSDDFFIIERVKVEI